MPKFLNNIFLVTQSSPSAPSSGGSLYTSGNSIYFKNSAGVEYNLTGSKGYMLLTEYTSSAGGTWTTPTDAKYIKIVAVGGGGSGGGGGRNSVGSAVAGGGGGQGGQISIIYYPISSIPPGTYTVTVSPITSGGSGRTGTNGNGVAGTTGGTTSLASGFVTLITATGGGGGGGGLQTGGTTNGGAISPPPGLLNFGPFRMLGMNGGSCVTQQGFFATYIGATTALPNSDFHARNGTRGTAGGGGGSGLTAAPAVRSGGSGSGVWRVDGSLFLSGTPGIGGSTPANSGSNGISNVVTAVSLFSFSGSAVVTSSFGFGSGGHGAGSGNTAGTVVGGKGGNGGYFGAGGGGGGGAVGQNGGNGGDGGGGYLAILEYY